MSKRIIVALTCITILFTIMACVFSYKAGVETGWQGCIEENNLYDRYSK